MRSNSTGIDFSRSFVVFISSTQDKKGSENALYAAQLQLETIREQLIEILGQVSILPPLQHCNLLKLRETKVQDDFDSISHVMSTVKSEAIGAMAKQRTLCNQVTCSAIL